MSTTFQIYLQHHKTLKRHTSKEVCLFNEKNIVWQGPLQKILRAFLSHKKRGKI